MYSDYETLQPRLDALLKAHQEDIVLAASLEKRIAALVERHATHVRFAHLQLVFLVDSLSFAGGRALRTVCSMGRRPRRDRE